MGTVSPGTSASVPLGSFEDELRALVTETAPRLFAVVETIDELDGRVIAWGMADPAGGVEVVIVGSASRMSLAAPETSLRVLGRTQGASTRIVWLERPRAATPDTEPAAA